MSTPLFSVGTSRGGTTFFARIMSLNSNVRMASDPFLPLFRSYRTAVLRRDVDAAFDEAQPLNDYYFSATQITMMKAIANAELATALPVGEFERLIPRLRARMGLAATEVVDHLDNLNGVTYQELFHSGMQLLENAYGAKDVSWVGFNDNWAVEFLPALLRAFPGSKGIIIVRDPRAAMASAMKLRVNDPSKAKKVPLMYSFAHHWRKHAAFAYDLLQRPEFSGRLKTVRYEDVVTDPEQSVRNVCEYLGVEFNPAMLDTQKFRPLKGAKWDGHSNFDAPAKGIYTNSISAWKSFLSEGAVQMIEYVCGPEMSLHKYELTSDASRCGDAVTKFLRKDDANAIGWRNEHQDWETELELERSRRDMLLVNDKEFSDFDIEQNYLFASVFEACRAHRGHQLYNAVQMEVQKEL